MQYEHRRIWRRIAAHVVREVPRYVSAPLGRRTRLHHVHPEHQVAGRHRLAVRPLPRVQLDRNGLAAVGELRRLTDRVVVVDRRAVIVTVPVERPVHHVLELIVVGRAADLGAVHREDVVRRRIRTFREVRRATGDLRAGRCRRLRQARAGGGDRQRRTRTVRRTLTTAARRSTCRGHNDNRGGSQHGSDHPDESLHHQPPRILLSRYVTSVNAVTTTTKPRTGLSGPSRHEPAVRPRSPAASCPQRSCRRSRENRFVRWGSGSPVAKRRGGPSGDRSTIATCHRYRPERKALTVTLISG